MMKVKAKHWVNVEGDWHGEGEVFEVESIAGIGHAVEVIASDEPKPVVETPKEPEPEIAEKPVSNTATRRTRKVSK